MSERHPKQAMGDELTAWRLKLGSRRNRCEDSWDTMLTSAPVQTKNLVWDTTSTTENRLFSLLAAAAIFNCRQDCFPAMCMAIGTAELEHCSCNDASKRVRGLRMPMRENWWQARGWDWRQHLQWWLSQQPFFTEAGLALKCQRPWPSGLQSQWSCVRSMDSPKLEGSCELQQHDK